MKTAIFHEYSEVTMNVGPHDIEIRLAPAMYILNKLGNKTNKQKLFKILYFADKDYISKFGRPFSQDRYIAMDNGPVPSRLYDYIKALEGKSSFPMAPELLKEIADLLSVQPPYYVLSKRNVNMDFLSSAAVTSLDKCIQLYKDKTFGDLSKLSHDGAWKHADSNSEISVEEIARDAGANEEMIKYIRETN